MACKYVFCGFESERKKTKKKTFAAIARINFVCLDEVVVVGVFFPRSSSVQTIHFVLCVRAFVVAGQNLETATITMLLLHFYYILAV